MAHSSESTREQSPVGDRPNMSDLRIVLLGKNASENNKVGNLILDKNVFGKKLSPDVEKHSGKVEGRNITVISTVHLLKSNLSMSQIKQKVSALSPSEPDVIILVLQHNDFSSKIRPRLPLVLNCFGEQVMKRTMIVTTDKTCSSKHKSEYEYIQQITKECGGGHLQLKKTQHSQILQKVDEIIIHEFKKTKQGSLDQGDMRSEDRKHEEMKEESSCKTDVSDLRIVFLGKSVSENSGVGNFLLGRAAFDSEAPPDVVERVGGRLKDRHVMVINSPQLLQTNISDHQLTQTVRECVSLSDPGPHVFILVLQYKDFTEEDMTRVKYVMKEFSEEAIKRTIVITTDEKTCGAKDAHVNVNELFQQLTAECGGRHLQLDERKPEWQSKIFQTVDMILIGNNQDYLTYEIYEDVKGTSTSAKQEQSKSEEKMEECSHHKDDGKPKEIKKDRSDEVSLNFSGKQKLNLVLCGSDTTLNISVSKILQGKKINPSHQRESSEECVKENVHGHQISIVELPAFCRLSEDEVRHYTLSCVSLCDPGVHAFLLIIPAASLTDEDKAQIEKIQKIFDSREHFILLFTTESTVEGPMIDFLNFSPESQGLISLYQGRYRVIGLNEPENSRQISELLDCIENMKIEPYSLHMYVKAQENRVRRDAEEKYKEELKRKIKELEEKIQPEGAACKADDQECLRIVLIGKTGNGKSATGNSILGRKEFVSQLNTDSVTTVCEKRVGEVDGRSVAVVDTPGLFDTTLSNDQVVEEIVKCVSLSSPGPHVFVIVLSLGRITKEEMDTMDLIKKIFGPKAAQFSIVLFTRGDDLEDESIEDYVERSNNAELKKLIRDCGNRFLVFNNKEKRDRSQVTQLLNMIEELKNTNKGRYFTNSMFEEAEMSIKKRMEDILRKREKEIQAQNEALKAKYEMDMKNMMKRLEEEKQRSDEEKMKMQNQLKEKEEKLKKEFEEKEKTEQMKREIENQKRSEEEERKRAKYHQKMDVMKREIEHQKSQYEKQQKQREEEDRKREEKYRQDQEKMKNEQERIIAELRMKEEEETKKRESEEKMRIEEEEKERQGWERKIKEAVNDRKETQEEIKRHQREWEDEKKRQMREREEEERRRKEKHEEQLREKQEELEKMRKTFERERKEERKKVEKERQKQKKEREEKEREYEEKKNNMKKHYEQLERERKEEWEKIKQEDDERREEERKRWKEMIEDLKQEQEEEIKRREREEKERKEREEKERDEMKQKHEQEIKVMKKNYQDEARKQAEELNDFKEGKEQLQKMLEEHQKQYELLDRLHKHLQLQKEDEIKELKDQKEKEIKELKDQKEKQIKELKYQKEKEIKVLNDQKEKEIKELKDQKEKEIKELKDQKEKERKQLKDQKEKEIKELKDQKEKEIKELKDQKEKEIKELQEKEKEIKELKDKKEKEIKELQEKEKERKEQEDKKEKERKEQEAQKEKERKEQEDKKEKERKEQEDKKEKERKEQEAQKEKERKEQEAKKEKERKEQEDKKEKERKEQEAKKEKERQELIEEINKLKNKSGCVIQ